ncbi:hypothetical protein EJ08DRAFT_663053 [Tothia fuscella]|uniref:Uncharacterized protein n=1 Tax=Tothia fuscella TaxID=1048955 RepID=A0A9P4NMA4_9PEZI|nr:hypothetical protein EJ08DRAFT_663053 [Tothia fuscella]
MSTTLTGTNFLRALYAANLLWHTSAFYHFSFRAPYMMTKLSKRSSSKSPAIASTPEGDEWHHDVMAYLGLINVGFAALAGMRLYSSVFAPSSLSSPLTALSEADILALMVLGIANGSQAWGNFVRTSGNGRWIMGSGWDRITVLDAVFMILDFAVMGAHLWNS